MSSEQPARDSATPGLESELRQLLGAVSLQIRITGDDLATRTGLSPLELGVLARLVVQGPTSAKILIADLALPRSTMTALADRLEAAGLVSRTLNPDDRRSVVLAATPAAEQALGVHAHERFGAVARSLLAATSEAERDTLAALLRRMRQTLSANVAR